MSTGRSCRLRPRSDDLHADVDVSRSLFFSLDDSDSVVDASRHSKRLMERALSSLHNESGSLHCEPSWSDEDDAAAPRQALRSESHPTPRRGSQVSGILEEALSVRRNSQRLQSISPAGLHDIDTPAGASRPRHGRHASPTVDSIMKISRTLTQSSATPLSTSPQEACDQNLQSPPAGDATQTTTEDRWSAILRRCSEVTRILLPLQQPVPKNLMQVTSDCGEWCRQTNTLASSFSIYLSSSDNSQSSNMSSNTSSEEEEIRLTGTLDALLGTQPS